jgi:cell division protein FtsB
MAEKTQMRYQTIINVLLSVALSFGGWFAREVWGAVDRLRTEQSALREELPKTYLTKNDFKDGVLELKQLLVTIDSKLDRKADKK